MVPSVPVEQASRVGPVSKALACRPTTVALVASAARMSETESGWQSSWQRPAEGEWKQAPDGSWYKDTGSPPPSPPPSPRAPAPAPAWGRSRPGQFAAPPAGSGKAVASLVLGIGGLSFCPFVLSVFALVLGYQARAELDRAGAAAPGRAQATAGIVLGWIGVTLFVVLLALFVVGVVIAASDAQIPSG
jgi:hypothetical protein